MRLLHSDTNCKLSQNSQGMTKKIKGGEEHYNPETNKNFIQERLFTHIFIDFVKHFYRQERREKEVKRRINL